MDAVIDVACTVFQLSLFALMGALYGARTIMRGRQSQRRLDSVEGNLLGKPVMEVAYWFVSPLVRLLVFVRATPNQVTAASLVSAFFSGIAIATGHLGIGGLLSMIAGFCDLLDGVLARRLGTSSDAGEIFDATIDRYGEFFFMTGIAVYLRAWLPLELLAIAGMAGGYMVSYATAKAEAAGLPPPRGLMRRAERAVYITTGASLTPVLARFLSPEQAANPLIANVLLIVPLALVAVLANASAISRMYKTAVMARERAERTKAANAEDLRTRSAG
jgi:CDP-diacylglycerol--glycerol-3-phosphate 3-phosphatidyltransferase